MRKDLSIVWPLLTVWKDMLMIFQCFPPILVNISLSYLTSIYAQNLDLPLRLDKCISVIFHGNKMDQRTTFSLSNGSTHNIKEAPAKILGKLFAGSSFWQNKQWLPSWIRKSFQPFSIWMTDLVNLKSGYGKIILPTLFASCWWLMQLRKVP